MNPPIWRLQRLQVCCALMTCVLWLALSIPMILAVKAQDHPTTPTETATVTPTPTNTPTATPPYRYQAATWTSIRPGLEYGLYFPPYSGGAQLIIVRVDPSAFAIRAHYRAGEPLHREEWQAALACPMVLVNANFFDLQNQIEGLLVTDGLTHGTAFEGIGGIFQIDSTSRVSVRSTIAEPYDNEPLWQAVQGYPMLILNGRATYPNNDGDIITRRTAVAIDRDGHVLLIGTPGLGIRLATLADYLTRIDIEIVSAVNLDGGSSSLMYVNTATEPKVAIDSLYPVPSVLAIYAGNVPDC